MKIDYFLNKLTQTPKAVEFQDTMAVIEANYTASPSAFENGGLSNSAEENQGSCKLLALAQLHNLSVEATLACFGHYYREDVLQHPEASDHQNIRNFMSTGWEGVSFAQAPLALK
jgi:hypothetical protein